MEKTRLTNIQKLIGKRMLKSKLEKPCFYLEVDADITELMGLRHKLKKQLSVKITTNAFYIRALALAVKKYPLTAGKFKNGVIKIASHINVGFAVNAPHGLVVPVIKDADKKTLAQIAILEKELTAKARSNKLTIEEIDGETTALSNLGAYGIDSFIGIVPPPATTILSVGNAINKIVPINGQCQQRKMVTLTVSADHKVLDGAYAAKFLTVIAEQLQNPQQLI